MKMLGFLALNLAASAALWAQGTVDFNNYKIGFDVNAPVYDTDGAALLGTGFLGQLYAGTTTNALVAAGTATPFKNQPGTSIGTGYIVAGKVVLHGIPEGSSAWVELRAWDAGAGATYESALAAGAACGKSAPIQVQTAGDTNRWRYIPAPLIGLASFRLEVALAIVTQPTNQTVVAGQSAVFTIIATGSEPLSYQWRFNGTNLSAATGSSYTIANAQPSNAGPYQVVVSNSGGSKTSAVATLTVNAGPPVVLNTNDSGPGSLRQAIAYASSGATVTFTNTLSGQTILLTSGQILVTNNLTIDASSLPGGIAINGNGSSRIFECASGTTNTLIGLTLTNGLEVNYGGAILVNSGATLTISDSTLSGNLATNQGGAIYNGNACALTIHYSTLSGNSVINSGSRGGGIYNTSGTLTLYNSTLSHNSASDGGGGIFNNKGTSTLTDTTLSGNTADDGGGIFNHGTLTLANSTLSANSATNYGGGIYIYSGTPTLTNSIVAENSASTYTNIYGSFTGSHNVIDLDPMLAPLGDYGGPTPTMPPLPGSPTIDAGTNMVSLPATDQRGFPRKVGTAVDIGAVEFQGAGDVALFWSNDWDGDGSPFGVELALGTDPLQADLDALGYPEPYPPATGNGITFGFNAAATNYTAWVVKRSLDLSVPRSLVEILRYDGPTGITTKTNNLSVIHTPDTIQITDTTTPQPPAAFYQLSIEPSP